MAVIAECMDNGSCQVGQDTLDNMCINAAEPHSTLCEQHGGEADLDHFLAEWEHHIDLEEQLCSHIWDQYEPGHVKEISDWIKELPEWARK